MNSTLDFLGNWNNALLLGGCVTYFGSRFVLPLMGKTSSQFPCIEKMSQQFGTLWTFDFSATALSSFYSLYQDCQVMRSSGNPSNDRSLPFNRDLKVGVERRIAATALKLFSTFVLLRAGLHGLGALSSGPGVKLQTAGAVAGLMGHSLDFYELSAQKKDSLINENWPDDDSLRVPYEANIIFQQVIKGLVIGLKTISVLALLSKTELPSPARRIFNAKPLKFVVDNQPLLTHSLLVSLLVTSYLKEIDPRLKKGGSPKSIKTTTPEFIFQDLPKSSELTKLIEALSEMLVELGLETLGDLRLLSLGKGAKALSDFRNLPKVFADIQSVISSANECIESKRKLSSDPNSQEYIKGFHRSLTQLMASIANLTKDLAGALKYIGAFGGVAYLSSRVQLFSNIKNFLGAALALQELIVKDIPGCRRERDFRGRTLYLLLLVMHSGILFQSGLGGAAVKLAGRVTKSTTRLTISPRFNKAVALMTASCAVGSRYLRQRP